MRILTRSQSEDDLLDLDNDVLSDINNIPLDLQETYARMYGSEPLDSPKRPYIHETPKPPLDPQYHRPGQTLEEGTRALYNRVAVTRGPHIADQLLQQGILGNIVKEEMATTAYFEESKKRSKFDPNEWNEMVQTQKKFRAESDAMLRRGGRRRVKRRATRKNRRRNTSRCSNKGNKRSSAKRRI
jgi:hypothetical protein